MNQAAFKSELFTNVLFPPEMERINRHDAGCRPLEKCFSPPKGGRLFLLFSSNGSTEPADAILMPLTRKLRLSRFYHPR